MKQDELKDEVLGHCLMHRRKAWLEGSLQPRVQKILALHAQSGLACIYWAAVKSKGLYALKRRVSALDGKGEAR